MACGDRRTLWVAKGVESSRGARAAEWGWVCDESGRRKVQVARMTLCRSRAALGCLRKSTHGRVGGEHVLAGAVRGVGGRGGLGRVRGQKRGVKERGCREE